MTCKQARPLLAAYRRHDRSPDENAELQAHLLECAECRARAAEFQRIGESLQALPKLTPPPDFYARVMAAVHAEDELAAERAQAAARKKPEKVVIPGLTDIAYLPAVRRAVMQRRARVAPLRSQMSPAGAFALRYSAGLAALFLLFALGVSAALFELLRSPPIQCVSLCPTPFSLVYHPDPAYPLVADATASADGQYIIYVGHNASGNWMLEELNRQSQKNTALLPAPVAGPLTLEGWARSWVLWAQGVQGAGNQWQLDATELSPALPGAAQTVCLLQGNVTGPDGKVAALHGVSALGSTVLLAEALANGHGQLVSLDLTAQGDAKRSVIATTPQPDHLITDPAAAVADPTTGAMMVYWVEQWQDPDGTLHGNIWRLLPGGSSEAATTNGVSFSPMIVADTLFWLEEPLPQSAGTTSGQPAPSPIARPPDTTTPGSGKRTDSQVAGIIWSENLNGSDLDTARKTSIAGIDTPVSDPQAGATFVFWQYGQGNYRLYDVPGNHTQPLNEWITNPLALSISPTAVLWVTNDSPGSSQAASTRTVINLLEWPHPQR